MCHSSTSSTPASDTKAVNSSADSGSSASDRQ
jgi:hypothetical protein